MEQVKNYKFFKIIIVLLSILICIPSVVFYANNRTTLRFNGDLEFCFLLTKNINRIFQTIVYLILILLFIFFYYQIIKHRKKIFENMKQVYLFILIISLIFVLVIPFWCSDVFYYMGIGRLSQKYGQNPYYTDMESYIDNNDINLNNDTLMLKGYKNVWSNTTCVYGAFWTMICSTIAFLSFGNLDIGLLIFKLVAVIVHLLNCYLIYKISNKKIFTLFYGLSPFILIEGIANVHNDLFVLLFLLLAIFFLLKKKNIVLSIVFLALATDIKYFTILFLPLIVLYHYRDKDIKTKILKCIEYGLLFLLICAIPYLLYIKDLKVLAGIFTQQNKIAKGLYIVLLKYLNKVPNIIDWVKTSLLTIFVLLFIMKCIYLLSYSKLCFRKEMRTLFSFVLAFVFLLITNFQPWYLIWLTPFMIWQKSDNIKLLIQMQLMTLIANCVFLLYSENYIHGVKFFITYVVGVLLCYMFNKRHRLILKKEH